MSKLFEQHDGNLIVNYLPTTYREAEVYDLFVPYGNLLKVKVIYHKDTDESMTYGFVRFQNPNDAIHAMNELNGRDICGKRIKVSFARRGIDTTNCKLYVKRVPPSYSLDDIHKLFSQFGEILEARLLTDNKGHSRQVAFIHYTNRMDADTALMRLSGVIPPGASQALIVKHATQPPHPESSTSSHEQLLAQLDRLKLKYQGEKTLSSGVPVLIPPPPTQSVPSSTKIENYSQTKPRSSDWPSSPPLPPSLSSSSPSNNYNNYTYQPHNQQQQQQIQSSSPNSILEHPLSYDTTVTITGVPPSLDLMDFSFLSKYGKVSEGKMLTRDVQVIYPDGTPIIYQTSSGIFQFKLGTNTVTNLQYLLSLHNSMIVIEGHSLMIHVSYVR